MLSSPLHLSPALPLGHPLRERYHRHGTNRYVAAGESCPISLGTSMGVGAYLSWGIVWGLTCRLVKPGLRSLGALAGALALTTVSLALLVPGEAHAGSSESGVAVAFDGAASAIAAAQATSPPVPPVPVTDTGGTDPAPVPQAAAGAVAPADVAQTVSRAIAAAQAPALNGAAGPAPAPTTAADGTAPVRPAASTQSALAQSPPAQSDRAVRAPSAPAADPPNPARRLAPVSGGSSSALAKMKVSQTLIPAGLGQVMPTGLDTLVVMRIPTPSGNLESLLPSIPLPSNPGATTGEPPVLSGDTLGVPAWQDPGGMAGFPDPVTLTRVAAAEALLSAPGAAFSVAFPPMPDSGGLRAAADLSASSALQGLVPLLLSATSGSTFGTPPLMAARHRSTAETPALAGAALDGAIWSGEATPAMTAQGMPISSEQAARSTPTHTRMTGTISRPGSAPASEAPPSLPPSLAGGASVTPGVGIGSGTSAIALIAALVFWLSQFIPGRVSLELKGWRSTLLTLRLERPG